MHFPFILTAERLARIIVLLTLAAGLAACSAVRLGYNTLGDVAYWWLDSYFDFTATQSPHVREDLARLHLWHRTEELPRFERMLQAMERLAPGEITPAQACTFVAEFRQRLAAVAKRAEPASVTLAITLDPGQLKHLQHKYDRNNAEYAREWVQLPAAERREKRFRQFLDRSEMIYGRLEEPQREALRRDIEGSIFDPQRLLSERRRRQQDALQTLGQLAGQPIHLEQARRLMRESLQRALTPPEPAARGYQEALLQESCRHFAVLHNSTSAAQREAAVRRLRAYQRDLRELAAQR